MSAARPADRRRLAALAAALLAPAAGAFDFISDFNGAFAAAWNHKSGSRAPSSS